MERQSPADYLDDPLTAHPRYRKLRDLNEGTFGVVVLAQDVRIKEPVRCSRCLQLVGRSTTIEGHTRAKCCAFLRRTPLDVLPGSAHAPRVLALVHVDYLCFRAFYKV